MALYDYKDYAQRVVDGQQVAGLYIRQACQRYLSWFDRKDLEFRADAVDRVIRFISQFKHYTGRSAGKPFVLTPFQVWITAAVFGWYKDGVRLCNSVYIEMARKNGKSFYCSALALYCMCADGEPAAEVEIIANSSKQAQILYSMARYLAQQLDPAKKFIRDYRDKLKFAPNKAVLQVLSSDSGTNDGWNSSAFFVDEYHAAPDSKNYDVLLSSQGQRTQPLSVVITTAGFNLNSPCYAMRSTNIEILSGLKTDDTVFAAIFTLDDGDNWQDPANFEKTNPNLGVTVTADYLQKQITTATNNAAAKTGIQTKNFNLWLQSADIWLSPDDIIKHSAAVDLETWRGKTVYAGVDLASVSDLTAVSFMLPDAGRYQYKTWYFVPQSALINGYNAIKYLQWKRNGELIVTDGNVCDYDYILTLMLKTQKDYNLNIALVSYDNWNATSFATSATEAGLYLRPYSQSIGSYSRTTKEFERQLKGGNVTIDNNSITRYCFSNATLKFDHNENCKPVKAGSNNQKIDGVIAILTAQGGYLATFGGGDMAIV